MVTASTNTSISPADAYNRVGKEDAAPTYMAVIFLISLVIPILINVGSVLLMPHRVVLLIFFFPCAIRLLTGKAGRIIAADWLIFSSTIWAVLSMFINHGVGSMIQPAGIHLIEFFGAYMLGRVAIRSAEDFKRIVKVLFMIILVLLPFAILESFTHRALLLEIIPKSIAIVYNPPRWGLRRAQTLFTHPIHYGVFCSLGMGLFWYVLGPKRRWTSIPIVVASSILSLSTAALINLVVQSVFIGWETITKTIKARWRIFAVIFGVMFVAVETLSNRGFFLLLVQYASFNTGSSYNRILIWRYGMENVYTNPFFGLAFRPWVRAHWMSSSADNFWLLNAMQWGIPSFFMFATAVGTILWKSGRTVLTSDIGKACQAGFLTAAGGVIVGGGTVHYWTAMMALVMFFFGAGAWIFTSTANASQATSDLDEIKPQGVESRYSRKRLVSRTEKAAKNKAEVHKPTLVSHEPKSAKSYRRSPTLHERRVNMRKDRETNNKKT
jgi:hypothetical protein